MPLREYETEVQLNTLYEVSLRGGVSGKETITPYISVNTGSINIHSITSADVPQSLEDMPIGINDAGVFGTKEIITAVRYVVFVASSGAPTEVVVSGLNLKSLGAIS